jgi:lipopolysaccharide/colanic/teichoic acid biosynthesis glycosyltransferase
MFDIGELHRARYGRIKRVVDVVTGAAGLLAMLALVPLVWLGNRFGNRGPLFYRQLRVGRGGTTFRIVKFRTMRPSAETAWTMDGDPRITPFGRWLRRTHLDEVPQAWNLLRGEQSLVGPRPEQPVYVDELSTKLPFYDLRHLVRPGLTGWAQVRYSYGAGVEDALEKLQFEFWYLRHQGLLLDMRIVGRTIRSVVAGSGR